MKSEASILCAHTGNIALRSEAQVDRLYKMHDGVFFYASSFWQQSTPSRNFDITISVDTILYKEHRGALKFDT
jgi:hypothetical protein